MSNQGTHRLSDSWQWVKISQVCEGAETHDPHLALGTPFRYVDISSIDNVRKRITETRTILGKDAPSRARQLIRANDVLVSTTRPNLNAVALVPPELDGEICSTGFCVLRPTEQIEPRFLFWFVQTPSFVERLCEQVRGGLYPAVTDNQARSVQFPLPPLDVQRALVAELDQQMATVARMRAAAERQRDAAGAMTDAILREVFESAEAEQWEIKKIGDTCSIHPGQHVLEPEYNRNRLGIGYLTGPADFGETYPSVTKWTEKAKAWCMPGDVLVTVKGAGVGKTNLAPNERVAIGRQLMAIRPNSQQLEQVYLYWVVKTHFLQLQARAMGATVPGVGREDIESLEIPLPSLTEQQSIVRRLQKQLEEARMLHTAATRQLEAINALPAALLREVFERGR